MGYIYKITNTLNNKIYIGQTVKTVEKVFNSIKTIVTKNIFLRLFYIKPLINMEQKILFVNNQKKFRINYQMKEKNIGLNFMIVTLMDIIQHWAAAPLHYITGMLMISLKNIKN